VLVKTVSAAKDLITGPVKAFDPGAVQKFSEDQNKKPAH
jgi:hypothetical protein